MEINVTLSVGLLVVDLCQPLTNSTVNTYICDTSSQGQARNNFNKSPH